MNKCIKDALETISKPEYIMIKIPEKDQEANADPFQIQIIFKITELCPFDKNIFMKLMKKAY